ncbi:MAG: hypothetical protein IT330_00945 [Anaerolineae bacterium]|nr:hypothetical protein [Anaerolineae bacterium]
MTLTGGHKLESPSFAPAEAERIIDHVAHSLGYRISIGPHAIETVRLYHEPY